MAKKNIPVSGIPKDFKIIHVLADGTEVDSIKGMVIPCIPETKMIYEILAKFA